MGDIFLLVMYGIKVLFYSTDSNGNEEWSHMFNEDEYGEIGNSVLQTLDGGYMMMVLVFLVKTKW